MVMMAPSFWQFSAVMLPLCVSIMRLHIDSPNPVPLVYFGRQAKVIAGGALRDIAPTMLYLLSLPKPGEMTGQPLLELMDISPTPG